jgi:ATP-dependent Clp protease ATP-binding subunit ClpC
MTSNVGADKLQKEASFGFRVRNQSDQKDLDALHEANETRVRDELKKLFRPELLNRIDKTIVFRALTQKDIFKIIDLQIDELKSRLQKKGLGLNLTASAKQYLLDKGYDAHNGVRPLRRLIQDTIEDHLALELLGDKYSKGDIIQTTAKGGKLHYTVSHE